ncbi:SMI1/KNR4 family protein [Nocardioides marmorisolisilvae]|uniref:SMI1/KNR4 family protein n=1 Tax=Nocardioides marmorisolisilvae TaxID=1542737 RepID=A0A3N0DZH1_9ACTN|nr:SMI1/KNR4 family protein [Nocardioides marmorisolisilvae]RNL80994.1 hypothetical protein EFL95_01010 [Nocardioides marmorisolisilvae]
MDVTDLNAWTDRVRQRVDTLMSGFEDRFGYPPGDNRVVSATRPGGVALRDALGVRAPAAVVEFFDAIEEVSLPDVWNGYFLGPVDWVLAAYSGREPGLIELDGVQHEVLVVGADGGGALYCVVLGEHPLVVRLDQVTIRDGIARTPPGFTQELAPDFAGFLEALAIAIEASVEGAHAPAF